MENFENIPSGAQSEPKPVKASPFEDSPYMMPEINPQPVSEPVASPVPEYPKLTDLPPIPPVPPVTPVPPVSPVTPVAPVPPVAPVAPVAPAETAEPTPKKPSTAKKVWTRILAIGIAVGVTVTACAATALAINNYWKDKNTHLSDTVNDLQDQIKDLEEKLESNSFTGNGNSVSGTGTVEGLTPGQVYAQNHRSVVAISNHSTTTNIFGQVSETASSGSGFIISADGYIITNYHVIEGATSLTVITSDQTEYDAKLVGYDDSNDFALIKIEATGLPFVTLGNSDDLIIGDQVVAIGNPLGQLTNSLTVGYVSAKERDVTTSGSIINMLQTDAAINPGNSGGPLFNMKGEVIGITTAKYSGTTSSGASIEGIGFAIPINDVESMVDQLIDNGYISAPYMGIRVSQRTDGMGVYVEGVDAGTPAEAAGLKTGDIIVGIGEYTVTSLSQLDKVLRNFEANQTTTIFVYRDRQVLEISLTFAEKNQAPAATPTAEELPEDASAEQWYDWWKEYFGN